jgi:hypothetical protein
MARRRITRKRARKTGVSMPLTDGLSILMILGDGIENLLCSADGTVWVGFDEGVFGGPNKNGSWPVSSGGIVQFDAAGTPLWSFNEQVRDNHSIAGSCAMTLSGTDLWACFYTDFPIARINGGKPVFWSNSVAGAKAIAVKDDIVMLGGGYSEDANRITLVKLDGESSRELGSFSYGKGSPAQQACFRAGKCHPHRQRWRLVQGASLQGGGGHQPKARPIMLPDASVCERGNVNRQISPPLLPIGDAYGRTVSRRSPPLPRR